MAAGVWMALGACTATVDRAAGPTASPSAVVSPAPTGTPVAEITRSRMPTAAATSAPASSDCVAEDGPWDGLVRRASLPLEYGLWSKNTQPLDVEPAAVRYGETVTFSFVNSTDRVAVFPSASGYLFPVDSNSMGFKFNGVTGRPLHQDDDTPFAPVDDQEFTSNLSAESVSPDERSDEVGLRIPESVPPGDYLLAWLEVYFQGEPADPVMAFDLLTVCEAVG